ncbi:hypothetical protein H5410_026111 [Solanum commersonii]|uniref:Uncharacterized protein n=1 Tax=Solanum commersonii TaxID=4109 RepID=A0A9J5YV54_SOLCO|nr:hypothetical protein H5410_026111 [Solanum commersonii]
MGLWGLEGDGGWAWSLGDDRSEMFKRKLKKESLVPLLTDDSIINFGTFFYEFINFPKRNKKAKKSTQYLKSPQSFGLGDKETLES